MSASNLPKIISGDGKSPMTAVRFERCDLKTRKAAERQFITRQYGEENVGWTSGIHVTMSPGSLPVPNALADLFKAAYKKFGADRSEDSQEKAPDPAELDDSRGLISQWNIDLADGTPKRVYFDTSNTIYDE